MRIAVAALLIAASTALVAAGTVSTAVAQPAPAAPGQQADGRFSISPTPDGYLKLDSRTGTVSECRRGPDGFACRLVADERDALQARIDSLRAENEALKNQIAMGGPAIIDTSPQVRGPDAQGSGAAPPVAAAPPSIPRDERPSAPPGEQEFDRALNMMERFMRRFMTILREESHPGERI